MKNKNKQVTSEKENTQDSFENDLEMLKYFQDEFQYRHKHYWEILIKFFTLSIGVTILPIVSGVFGLNIANVPRPFLYCFPAIGIMISILSTYILIEETKRMSAVNIAKYRINNNLMKPKYHYVYYNKKIEENLKEKKKETKIKKMMKKLLSYKIIVITFSFELLIAFAVWFILFWAPKVNVA